MSGRPETDEMRKAARQLDDGITPPAWLASKLYDAADHIDALHAAIDRLAEAEAFYDNVKTMEAMDLGAHLAAAAKMRAAVDAVIAEAR